MQEFKNRNSFKIKSMAKSLNKSKVAAAQSSKTGKFVTKKYTAKHKNTTEIEHHKRNK